ncbi:unnamed protein product [Symbiodinium natans]|uniref:Uncharacterized protein n=1 Tax=Symbiodinium natans TaxID=878477 RepID=A0A812KSA8_9DINO|nr:unnamed protein product [Symbiodinium natans]
MSCIAPCASEVFLQPTDLKLLLDDPQVPSVPWYAICVSCHMFRTYRVVSRRWAGLFSSAEGSAQHPLTRLRKLTGFTTGLAARRHGRKSKAADAVHAVPDLSL